MQHSVYIFGQFGDGYAQFPEDYTQEIFSQFSNGANAKSQIAIHRDKELMYYGYIRKLDAASQYIGFCILLNGVMLSKVKPLFSVFERAVQNLTAKGEILQLTERGDIISTVRSLSCKQQEIEWLIQLIGHELKSLERLARKLPAVSYGTARDESKTFSVADRNDDIVAASHRYGYTYILKHTGQDTAVLTSYRNVLAKLSDDKDSLSASYDELKADYDLLLRRKKQYKYVVILALFLIGCGASLLFLNKNLNLTKDELTAANRSLKNKSTEIKGLHGSLEEANNTILRKDDRIKSLTSEVELLNESINNETELRQQAESDYESFKSTLNGIQPFIVRNTSFNFSTGRLSFDYYGLREGQVSLSVRAYGDNAYANTSSLWVEKGWHSASIYVGNGLNSNKYYSFELLIGNKIIGGGRH